jgi:hypothetical protein
LPYFANDICGFKNRINTVVEVCIIGKVLGFEDMDSPMSDSAWIRIHGHSQTRTLQDWNNRALIMRSQELTGLYILSLLSPEMLF